ncbi:IPTL-CTERM sorting domain-containing protein [Delftia lacustris]|nr:IPTL-CTERM sorting domain-containing protein [Delftia lacustris]
MSSGVFRTWVLGGIFALVTYTGSASAQLILSASHTDASCNGANNGTATAQITQNGVAPFTYSWSPSGGTNATATGLTAGTYTVTVTDNNGLQGTASTTVGQPETLSGTQSQINPVGGNNGSATVVATGGTPGYAYSWTPSGGAAATATGLAPGQYSVTITDSKACQTTLSYTLVAPAASVQSVSVPPDGTYSAGQNLQFTVTYSAPVTVTAGGTPSIPLTIGSTLRQANFVGGSNSSALTFIYTVQPGDVDANGVSLGTAIDLNGSTMTSGGANVVLNLANVGATTGVLVNGQQNQNITFPNPGDQTFGTTPTLTATASSSLPVAFSANTTAVCTVTTGGTLTFVNTGSCTVDANQSGSASYLPASQVSQTFMVNAAAPGAPTIGNIAADDGQATVAFTAPASNGGAPITGYTVIATPVAVPGAPGVITQQGTTSPIVVAGLSNGFTYNFTVAASNGTTGAASASTQATPRKLQLVSAPGSVPGMTGIPSATMSGGGTTCTLQPGGGFGPVTSTPPNLQAPSGQFAFSAENCTGSVTMTLTYPSALPEGVQFRKPDGVGGWFDPATALNVIVDSARTTVTYTITDNGPGDTNPAVGVIADPLVPVLAAAPAGGAAAVPTLSEWGAILMSALLAIFGLRRMRRQR